MYLERQKGFDYDNQELYLAEKEMMDPLSLVDLGLKSGDKVLVPACTWVTNIGPVIQLGFVPVFCDINLKDFSFCEEHLKDIAVKHSDIKLIFVTHLLGYSSKIEQYKDHFPDAQILEDVCESHGCLSPSGNKRGSEYLGGTFSFYFGHHMTTIEGGMISTNNEELADLMRVKRSHGLARETKKFDEYKEKNPEIIKVAKVMHEFSENLRQTLNAKGANIPKMWGWVVKHSNDMFEVRSAANRLGLKLDDIKVSHAFHD